MARVCVSLPRSAATTRRVAWSPDGSQLFVHGGTGSFIVDATTGDVAEFPYLAGYGGAAWTSAWPT
jgi:hypothetical protein